MKITIQGNLKQIKKMIQNIESDESIIFDCSINAVEIKNTKNKKEKKINEQY